MRLWNGNNQLIKKWQEKVDYSPQTRPWFKLAQTLDSKTPSKWTKPYSFYTMQTPGVTGVSRWKGKDNKTYILAYDVTLSDIARSLSSKEQDTGNIAYLLSPDGAARKHPIPQRESGNRQFIFPWS